MLKEIKNIKTGKYIFLAFGLATIAAVIILSALISCSPGQANVFSAEDSGTTVALNANESFSVKLESNQTTGYSWKLSEKVDTSVVTLVSSVYEVSKKDKEMVGAGGFETFNFKALSPGKTEILLEYVRPWEEGAEPEDTFILFVEVR